MHAYAQIVAATAVLVAVSISCGADEDNGGSTLASAEEGEPSASDDAASTDTAHASSSTSADSTETTVGPLEDPFAGCFHTWTFEGCPADWEVGGADPAAPSPPGWTCGEHDEAHTGVWKTSPAGDYTEDQSSFLASPSFSLADCAGATVYLSLAHLYQFGSGDGGTVQISIDGGASWATIEPTWHGYCAGTLAVPWSPPGGEPGFCDGDKDAWIHTLVELDAYGGEADVRVRFVFGADGIIEQVGWFIDSVATEAY